MKIYISYFYAVRFFKPSEIPMSTALYDPAWFRPPHRSQYRIDKRGVINGLRATPFAMIPVDGSHACETCDHNPEKCAFLPAYRDYLDTLDFDDMMKRIESLANAAAELTNDSSAPWIEPTAVLLVHEAPSNPCSERQPIIDWFAKHGVTVEEYPVPKKS